MGTGIGTDSETLVSSRGFLLELKDFTSVAWELTDPKTQAQAKRLPKALSCG